ncbi:unnamed protein product, partial [marine sediment metagenome]
SRYFFGDNPVSDLWQHGDGPGRLDLFQGCWLVCQEEGCGQKYAVYDGLPIMLRQEAE